MKFFASIVAYAAMAFILGLGILQAVGGHYWLLAAGVIGYMVLLIKIGCLPSGESH